MQARAAAELERLLGALLDEARLAQGALESDVTPRRLVVAADGLPTQQPDVRMERKGPKVGAPDKAIEGFLKSVGLTLDQCHKRETPKGEVWFAVIDETGQPTRTLLAEKLPEMLAALPWPKSMRWGDGRTRWVRPIRSILCVFDGEVVPLRFANIDAGAETTGHRFLAPAPITVSNAASYRAALAEAHVMLDAAARAAHIRTEAERLTAAEGLALKPDEALIAENAGLVEWPVVLMGTIEEAFMALPPEVLTSAMRAHQKYFNVIGADGVLAPRFVMVANTETADGGAAIVAGNERVLRARLSDARFFWDVDRQTPLEARAHDLAGMVFHAKLGTLADKTTRLTGLARALAPMIPGADPDHAARAAGLCKADLVTEMVGEFPDLQGIMGRYYAQHAGEPEPVADAIATHYAPQGPSDDCPRAPVSVAVALADKVDTLAGFFAIGETPTGSKDPFGLRRATLGVIRLILENDLRLPLRAVFIEAVGRYPEGVADETRARETADALVAFVGERLKVHLRGQGVRHDLISAVFALDGEDDLVRVLARVASLEAFLAEEDGANLLTAYRRAANILRIEEKKDKARYAGAADDALLRESEERALHGRIAEVTAAAGSALAEETFGEAMAAMAALRAPVDAFFDAVTVNCDDPALRRNRLLLLSEIRGALDQVADFSQIEG